MLRSVRRAVSAREFASSRACASSASQPRSSTYWLAVSAATATRASCQAASAPSRRASAASRAARRRPNRSSSQLACRPTLAEVPCGNITSCTPRAADALASSAGSSAAPAAVRVARACSMREAALAIVGLAACAAPTTRSSSGSSNCDHQRPSSASVPPCGSGGLPAIRQCEHGPRLRRSGGQAGTAGEDKGAPQGDGNSGGSSFEGSAGSGTAGAAEAVGWRSTCSRLEAVRVIAGGANVPPPADRGFSGRGIRRRGCRLAPGRAMNRRIAASRTSYPARGSRR